jgi:hypothetical protein
MKSHPEQEPLATNLWTQAFYSRVAQGELWKREDQSLNINDYLGSFNGRTSMTYDEAASLTQYFLRMLSHELIREVPQASDRVSFLLSTVEGYDPAVPSGLDGVLYQNLLQTL